MCLINIVVGTMSELIEYTTQVPKRHTIQDQKEDVSTIRQTGKRFM